MSQFTAGRVLGYYEGRQENLADPTVRLTVYEHAVQMVGDKYMQGVYEGMIRRLDGATSRYYYGGA